MTLSLRLPKADGGLESYSLRHEPIASRRDKTVPRFDRIA